LFNLEVIRILRTKKLRGPPVAEAFRNSTKRFSLFSFINKAKILPKLPGSNPKIQTFNKKTVFMMVFWSGLLLVSEPQLPLWLLRQAEGTQLPDAR
jgi:hypothetical protein